MPLAALQLIIIIPVTWPKFLCSLQHFTITFINYETFILIYSLKMLKMPLATLQLIIKTVNWRQ